jgi:hypothetical protein
VMADLSPYKALPNQIALDEMNPPVRSLRGEQRWAAEQSLAMNWNEPDDVPHAVLNRVLEIEDARVKRLARAALARADKRSF